MFTRSANKMHNYLLIFGLCLAFTSLLMSEVQSTPQETCDNMNAKDGTNITRIRRLLNNLLKKENVTLSIQQGYIANLTLTIDTLRFRGVGDIHMGTCTVEDGFVTVALVLDDLRINMNGYNMTGTLADTLFIEGAGDASVKLDNFKMTLTGDLNSTDELHFDTTHLDLDLWRWTVDFQGFMVGTDMQYLFNEFMSMIGPETIEAFEIYVNEHFCMPITKLANYIIIRGDFGPSGSLAEEMLVDYFEEIFPFGN